MSSVTSSDLTISKRRGRRGWGGGESDLLGAGEDVCDDGSDGWTDVGGDEMGDGMAVDVLMTDDEGLDRARLFRKWHC